jgi:predicted peptidase
MSYWYRTEADASPKRPLLLYLHGQRQNAGDDVAQTTTHGPWIGGTQVENGAVVNELRKFFRVAPHIREPNGFWDAGLLAQLVREVRRQHAEVSPDRLVVVGLSRGGKGALDFIAAHGQDLGVAGAVVCCPESTDNLNTALEHSPICLFHAPGDKTVELTKARADHYDSLLGRSNFRWVAVHNDWTRGEKHHNCWTDLFGHPALYAWLTSVLADGEYRNNKWKWTGFADHQNPKSAAMFT